MRSSEMARLLRRPGFARYSATVAAVRATGTMFEVAAVLLVLERTHSLALAGIVAAAASLPGAITGPFLGGWLDVTTSRRRLLVLDRLLTALAVAAVLLLAGHAPNWVLPIAAMLYGIASPLSAGAFSAALPEVAGPELLGAANAFEAASFNLAFIVGPALAGVIAGAAGPATAVEVPLIGGLLLAAAIARDKTFELRPVHPEARPQSVLHAVREGLAASWLIAPLRWNLVIDCVYVLAWGALIIAFPAYAVSIGAGAHSSGYMWAFISLGSMIGALGLRRAGRSPVLMGWCFVAMAISAAAWPLATSLLVAFPLILLTGLFDGPGFVGLISIRQRVAPPQVRAQIFTTASSIHAAVFAAGQAGAGVFYQAFGTTATLFAVAGLFAVVAAVAFAAQTNLAGSAATSAQPAPP
ncbi:MAG TPA: MFS transporter [Solirubrobacteraceae bacterium]|jgi:MFS family permease|nr:MFS transporter [Solirubrobacteraceae bacterium]